MLKLENFDALRLSIASPEMVLSWSHGEVTKPETINYRTLKPERDGLFCEKIFGPTKDWECHCGKYKRYRYKGIICDKCGVEVTRSKVRRERMGHIKLASPVSHVWYFKGIPSRMGLLLDMSPRNLEKVLYFANYIVTHIDEPARLALLEKLDKSVAERISALGSEQAEAQRNLTRSIEEKTESLQKQLASGIADAEAAGLSRKEAIRASRADLEERIISAAGKKAPAAFSLGDGLSTRVVIPKGTPLSEELVADLDLKADEWTAEVEAEVQLQLQQLKDELGAQIAAVATGAAGGNATHAATEETADEIRKDVEKQREELEALAVKDLLTDVQYHEYVEKYGKVFKAGIGAAAIRDLLGQIDLVAEGVMLREESRATSGQRRQKAIKRLRVVEAFRKSDTMPSWMVLDVLPVIPPELRPMVQLDGGRFATSDLNDLYRRVINRNNRLKRLLELGAPEIIVRNEKRMLQEAVDALIDNGRRGRAITGTGNRKLKSLSDMLKGKQGRFRQNLLGKRVDYSGRSVIVVGPELKLHQCGLPKKMALELFKPFVMRELVGQNYTQNIKSAKRMVERVRPEVWDVLDEVIRDHPVLLNRAPTLHRLGIQAFMPVLVEGQAIQLHPLVCKAFNADFDGDQMAVHVPLFSGAVAEARNLMMSSNNILNAANGSPVIAPSQDIVLGSYYLTMTFTDLPARGERKDLRTLSSPEEVLLAYEHQKLGLHDAIAVRMPLEMLESTADRTASGTRGMVITTVGRVVFNQVLPLGVAPTEGELAPMTFQNEIMDSKKLASLIKECFDKYGAATTAVVANNIKKLGFNYATRAGITVSAMDIKTPEIKKSLILAAESAVADVDVQFRRGLITEDERYVKTVDIWTNVTDRVTQETMASFDPFSSVLMMSKSGARGSVQQVRQLAGMRGLVADPTGRIIDLPIKSNFSEGLTVLEYFISTHGARKGLADTALRTADSGYLTRRLVDVAQDVIVREEDCGSTGGIWVPIDDHELGEKVTERISGRVAAQEITLDNKVIVAAGAEITSEHASVIYSERERITHVKIRSTMNCKAREGVCRACYGRNLATGKLVEIGEAVGVIAAQSIGEPGTQLTMRTFHTGGVATGGADITQGLPRVEELFEARVPKGKALISEVDGEVEIVRTDARSLKIRVVARDAFDTSYPIPKDGVALIEDGARVDEGAPVIRSGNGDIVTARHAGIVKMEKNSILVRTSDEDVREYAVPSTSQLKVTDGQHVNAGDQITEGSISPQELLLIRGRDDVQSYLVHEVQKVYRSQGVEINDKHIEVIVRQMMRKVRVENPGDTELLPGEIVSQMEWEEANAAALAEGGEPAIAQTVLLGLIKAALNTTSWLSAASFQETTRVLTEAAISGKVDRLRGLKENVIIGKLIPAGTGLDYYSRLREEASRLYAMEQEEELLAEMDRAAEDAARAADSPEAGGDEEDSLMSTGDNDAAPEPTETTAGSI